MSLVWDRSCLGVTREDHLDVLPHVNFFSCGLLDLDVMRAPLERISKGCRVLDALVIGSMFLISIRLLWGIIDSDDVEILALNASPIHHVKNDNLSREHHRPVWHAT